MSALPSAAILGWAARTALGDRPEQIAARLLAGDRAERPSPRFDQSAYAIQSGAAIPAEPRAPRERRLLRRGALFALDAAREAIEQAGCGGGPRVGLFSAVGGLRAQWDELLPALIEQRDDGQGAWERGLSRMHPFWMLRHLSNNAHALLSAEVQAKGEGATFGGAVAGAEALAAAVRALADGAIDAAIVLAHDSLLEPEALVELGARDPTAVPGEAAAAVVLVRPDEAGPRALAVITAASCADGSAGEPHPDTLGRAAAMVLDGRPPFLVDEPGPGGLASALGQCGAALAVVQVVVLGAMLRSDPLPPGVGLRKSEVYSLGLATGAPGLASAVLVQLPDQEGK